MSNASMDFPELEPNQRSTCPPERPDSCRWDGLDAGRQTAKEHGDVVVYTTTDHAKPAT